MVLYTIVPFLMGVALPLHKALDLSIVTMPLVAASTLNTAVWLSIYIIHHLNSNKVISHQRKLIMNRKIHALNYNISSPLVSIIIPARNEENVIKKTLLNCLQQGYKNIEVILVCHNSSDRTYQEAQLVHDNRIRILDFKSVESGKGVALNYGIDYSRGEYICLLDADGKMNSDFLQNVLPLFDEGYAAIQGKINPSNRQYNLITRLLSLEGDLYSVPFMTARTLLDKRTPLGGTGFVINKDILIKIGKFSNSLIDDFELSFRLFRNKYRIAFAPLAVVQDEKPPKFDIIFRQRARWMKGHIDLLRQRTAEPTDVLGTIYWLTPIFTLCGLLAIGIAAFPIVFSMFFGYYPYNFAFMPVKIWLISILLTFTLQTSLVLREPEIRNFKNILCAALLMLFANYWYIVLVKAFFVKGWANTKTIHGFEKPLSLTEPSILRDELQVEMRRPSSTSSSSSPSLSDFLNGEELQDANSQ
jgi:cellulose synthase/poly-beta-1,6-N-acetylglucosamine synthase-like glycosyltransferase